MSINQYKQSNSYDFMRGNFTCELNDLCMVGLFTLAQISGISNSATEVIAGQEFSAQIQGGLEQLLRTIFPVENANPLSSGLIPGPIEIRRQDVESAAAAAAAPAVSEEGIRLSNILRHLIPMITENVGTSSVQTQVINISTPRELNFKFF